MKNRSSSFIVCATLLLFLVALSIASTHTHDRMLGMMTDNACLACSWLHTLRWSDITAIISVLLYALWMFSLPLSVFPSLASSVVILRNRAPPVSSLIELIDAF
jgi:hypothetical protein